MMKYKEKTSKIDPERVLRAFWKGSERGPERVLERLWHLFWDI